MSNTVFQDVVTSLEKTLKEMWLVNPENAIHPEHQQAFINNRIQAKAYLQKAYGEQVGENLAIGLIWGHTLAMRQRENLLAPIIDGLSDISQSVAEQWSRRMVDYQNGTFLDGWEHTDPLTRDAQLALNCAFIDSCNKQSQTLQMAQETFSLFGGLGEHKLSEELRLKLIENSMKPDGHFESLSLVLK